MLSRLEYQPAEAFAFFFIFRKDTLYSMSSQARNDDLIDLTGPDSLKSVTYAEIRFADLVFELCRRKGLFCF